MILVSELKKTNLPREFLDILPETCDVKGCGAPNAVTEGLTALCCTNPFCPEKGVQRMVQLLKDIGVKGLGEANCRKFLENRKNCSPYQIMLYNPETDGVLFEGCSEEVSKKMYEAIKAKRNMPLWEFARIGNVPNIRDQARKLFCDYTSFTEFYKDLEKEGIVFIQRLLGIEKDKQSVMAMQILKSLQTYKDEFIEAEVVLEVKELKNVINAVMSSSVGGGYKTKSEFENKIHTAYGDKVYVNFLKSLTKECDYLIWSGEGAETSKVVKAKKMGIPIMNGAEFEEFIQKKSNLISD